MKKIFRGQLVILLIVLLNFAFVSTIFADDAPADMTGPSADTTATLPADTATTPSGAAASPSEATVPSPDTAIPPADTTTAPSIDSASTSQTESTDSGTGTTTVSSDNAATTTSTTTVEANTGENQASSTATTTIKTGDALATANIMNVVNVNVLNSDAFFAFITSLAQGNESIDLRALISQFNDGSVCSSCNVSTSTLSTTFSTDTPLVLASTNNATISNVVAVRSTTGGNSASGTDAYIQTGNAYANANIMNVANANFIDSHYMMLVLNSYGGLGDLVLPNASFFDTFLQSAMQQSNTTVPLNVNATNTADISNNSTTTSDTGNNTAAATSTGTTTDQSLIQTGDAQSGTNIINQANQNYIGGSSVALIFRVFGNWSGKVYNMPTAFSVNGTPISLYFLGNASGTPTYANGLPLTVSSDNSATINNAVSVGAMTGGNSTFGQNSSIQSGNAYATANIVNVANTNIIGRNWINAIINIFGDWNGNISFGQPNLWVGTHASFVNGYSGPGAQIEYDYKIVNNGDAPAHNVILSHTFDPGLVAFQGSDAGGRWSIGTLAPGQSVEVSRKATVADNIPVGQTSIQSSIKATADETDANTTDNIDIISVVVDRIDSISVPPPISPASFVVTKTNNADGTISASSTVAYSITIDNNGGYAANARLIDKITDEAGNVIHSEEWDLGAVNSNEEVAITYTALFNASTTSGVYTNTAQVVSADGSFSDSIIASSTVKVIALPATKVSELPNLKAFAFAKKAYAAEPLDSTSTTQISATDTATTTFVGSLTTGAGSGRTSWLASAFAAFTTLTWYWYLLALLIAILLLVYSERKQA